MTTKSQQGWLYNSLYNRSEVDKSYFLNFIEIQLIWQCCVSFCCAAVTRLCVCALFSTLFSTVVHHRTLTAAPEGWEGGTAGLRLANVPEPRAPSRGLSRAKRLQEVKQVSLPPAPVETASCMPGIVVITADRTTDNLFQSPWRYD